MCATGVSMVLPDVERASNDECPAAAVPSARRPDAASVAADAVCVIPDLLKSDADCGLGWLSRFLLS